jgi:hypothetical protein
MLGFIPVAEIVKNRIKETLIISYNKNSYNHDRYLCYIGGDVNYYDRFNVIQEYIKDNGIRFSSIYFTIKRGFHPVAMLIDDEVR